MRELVPLTLALALGLTACGTAGQSPAPATNPTPAGDIQGTETPANTEGFPFILTTKDGAEVAFTHVPEKVIAANGNAGGQLMALGLGDKIITTACTNSDTNPKWDAEYKAIPEAAETYISPETVLSLKPGFVYGRSNSFTEKYNTKHDTLTKHGIISLSSTRGYTMRADMDMVYQDFYNPGRILQVGDKAEKIVNGMRGKITAAEEAMTGQEATPVLVSNVAQEEGACTCGNNFISKLIEHAGSVNIFSDLGTTWAAMSWETVVERAPEVIVISDYDDTTLEEKITQLKENPALTTVSAIQNNRIISVELCKVLASSMTGSTVEKFVRAFHLNCSTQEGGIRQFYRLVKTHTFLTCLVLAAMSLASIIIGINTGPVAIPFAEMWRVMFHRLSGPLTGSELPLEGVRESTQNIIWFLQVPQVLLGALVGAALTLSGAGIRAFTKNPLAEPYMLSISSGASLGAVLAMLLGVSLSVLGRLSMSTGAFAGALISVLLVYLLARTRNAVAPIQLILVGVAISAVSQAFINYIVCITPDNVAVREAIFWMLEGLGNTEWADAPLLAGLVPPALLLMLALAEPLNAMTMGDSSVVTLGVNLMVVYNVLIGATTLLTTSSMAVGGCIGFVGLVIPHLVRSVVGPDHRKLVPLATLFGVIFLIWVDMGAWVIKPPAEIPMGILTAFPGVPLFLWVIKVRRCEFQQEGRAIIETKRVRCGTRSRGILRGMDFRVEEGEFAGFIDLNDSGESTFLRSVYKVLHPQAGELTLMGDNLLAMSNREMAQRLAVMVRKREAAFGFTMGEVVMMGRQVHERLLEIDSREDRALVGEILARTKLTSLREQGFSTLSDGEEQRVLIARVLAQQTAVLMLDEPTSHLNIKYQLQLMELVRGSGYTVVAAIYDLNLAAAYCRRLYTLKDGVIVGESAPKELLTPASPREVYEVEAGVLTGRDGSLRVFFCPSRIS